MRRAQRANEVVAVVLHQIAAGAAWGDDTLALPGASVGIAMRSRAQASGTTDPVSSHYCRRHAGIPRNPATALAGGVSGGAAAGLPLQRMLAEAHSGMLLFGITPPRQSVSPEQMREIAAATVARLAPVNLDGLALYDIDDESDRNSAERPFPYLPTLDPAVFHAEHLGDWNRPVVIYRCVGK